MRIDFYTKFVLTIIALCLVWMSLGSRALIPIVVAQQPGKDRPDQIVGGERVVIAGWVDHQGKIYPFEPVANRSGVPAMPGMGVPVSVVAGGR